MKKKKKGAKKKKSTKEKGPEEEKKNLYDIPEYIDPKIYTPKVELTIKLANPPIEHLSKFHLQSNCSLIAFKHTTYVTTRLEDIKRKIIEKHDGSIKDVTMCLGGYSKE